MLIHTVSQGDTVFSIARKYAVSPVKIIENNCLPYPDQLIPGQQLLILTPTRTYIVRGGDTITKVCRRFGIKKNTLVANNPALHGRHQLQIGTELVIRYDPPIYGSVLLNGYVYENTSADRFYTLLPYLTYATFSGRTDIMQRWIEAALDARKVPLLRVSWTEMYTSYREKTESFSKMLEAAQRNGFQGFTLTSVPRDISYDIAVEFLLEIKKQLLGMDMLLFQEMETESAGEHPDAADGIVALYEKCHKKEIPAFKDGECKSLENFARIADAGKAFLELSSFGYDGTKALTMEQIQKIAIKYGAEIFIDEVKRTSYLDYTFYKNGTRRPLRIHFECLENIKAKLELMHELGFMGAAVDVGRVPISYVMMLYTLFSGTENKYTDMF